MEGRYFPNFGNSLIYVTGGEIWEFDQAFGCHPNYEAAAIGSGACYALGALQALEPRPHLDNHQEILKKCVVIASMHDLFTDGDVFTHFMGDHETQQSTDEAAAGSKEAPTA
jgi:ATP-dependent protease HslVU (ClpYQ) peptidase subunit